MCAFMAHMNKTTRLGSAVLASGLSLALALMPAAAHAAIPDDAGEITDVLEVAESAAVETPTPSDAELPVLVADGGRT